MSDDEFEEAREYDDDEDDEERYNDNDKIYDEDDSRHEDEDEDEDEFEIAQAKTKPRKKAVQKETSIIVEKNCNLFGTFKEREKCFEAAFEESFREANDMYQGVNRVFGSRNIHKTLTYTGSLEVSKHLLSVVWSLLVILTNVLFIENAETFPEESQTKWLASELTNVVFYFFF